MTLTNGGVLDVRNSALFGADDGNNNGIANISIDATSQMSVLYDLTLLGGSRGYAAVYTSPLANTPVKRENSSLGRSLTVADSNNNRVTLNIDSTLAAGLAADTNINLDGGLNIGTGGNSQATVNVKAMNIGFGGGLNVATAAAATTSPR